MTSGTRRIEARVAESALEAYKASEATLRRVAAVLKVRDEMG